MRGILGLWADRDSAHKTAPIKKLADLDRSHSLQSRPANSACMSSQRLHFRDGPVKFEMDAHKLLFLHTVLDLCHPGPEPGPRRPKRCSQSSAVFKASRLVTRDACARDDKKTAGMTKNGDASDAATPSGRIHSGVQLRPFSARPSSAAQFQSIFHLS